jgi:hypothetical protein
MKTFKEYITEAVSDGLAERNKAVDIIGIVKSVAGSWGESHDKQPTDDEINKIVKYLLKSKTFSLGKMDDEFGSATVSTGFLKSVMEKVKTAINDAGFSKTGGASKTATQADRINSYLKQKHIGPIKR